MVNVLTATLNTKFTALWRHKLNIFLCFLFFSKYTIIIFLYKIQCLFFLLEADWATEY